MTNCKCGKTATHIAYLPSNNVYVGLRHGIIAVHVCDYHAEKAKKQGYDVCLL